MTTLINSFRSGLPPVFDRLLCRERFPVLKTRAARRREPSKNTNGLFAPLSLVLDQGPMFKVSRFAITSSRNGSRLGRRELK